MPLREFLAGLAFFLPTIIGAGAAATITARRYYGHLRGVELALAFALWLTLALLAAHIVPLALGILTRGTVVVTALALVGLAALLPGRPGPAPEAPRPPIAPTRPPSGLLASGATAAVAIYELAGLR